MSFPSIPFSDMISGPCISDKGLTLPSPATEAPLLTASIEARNVAKDLTQKYQTIQHIANKARQYAEEANKRQIDKTQEALKRVSIAQNQDPPQCEEEISSIRKKEYMEAITEQIKAERAENLAKGVQKLVLQIKSFNGKF